MPNSVVKRISADGSVGFPHVRVGHCQASKLRRAPLLGEPFFYLGTQKRLSEMIVWMVSQSRLFGYISMTKIGIDLVFFIGEEK